MLSKDRQKIKAAVDQLVDAMLDAMEQADTTTRLTAIAPRTEPIWLPVLAHAHRHDAILHLNKILEGGGIHGTYSRWHRALRYSPALDAAIYGIIKQAEKAHAMTKPVKAFYQWLIEHEYPQKYKQRELDEIVERAQLAKKRAQ